MQRVMWAIDGALDTRYRCITVDALVKIEQI